MEFDGREFYVLGEVWKAYDRDKKDDPCLKNCDGYCDKTTRKVVVVKKDEESDIEDYEVYRKKCFRHEIIHAFLFESGLHENFEHANRFGHEETMVDWFAAQYPKIERVFEKLGIDE